MVYVAGAAVVLILIVGFIISTYNRLVKARNKVKTNWSQIDVQLKKRSDLVPNLVETVKGYAKHESGTMEAVIKARSSYVSAGSIDDKIESSNQLTSALSKLMALTEAYPELKANENFMALQGELKEIEDKIAFARQFYNDTVYLYSNMREEFPGNIVAGMFGFKEFAFFEAKEDEKKVPEVQF